MRTAEHPVRVVDYVGSLARGTAGTSVSSPGAGRYNVTFTGVVSGCSYIATVGDPSDDLVFNPSGISTGSGSNSRTVYVETKNPGGGLQSGVPFHLALICASTADARYVVGKAAGAKQRASAGTTSARSATGRFRAAFNRNVTTCAAVATRGSFNTAVPFTPTTMEIVPGPNPSTVGFQVRQLGFFGGAFTNQSFHAAIVC
ncbi:MAG: hypothetical protein ACR2HK_04220 [Gemmatimonadales bacterium]